jgi:hypothetical protein
MCKRIMIMKKLISVILIFATLAGLSACAGAEGAMNPNAPGSSPLSEADMAGSWYVSQVLAPDGTPATSEEMERLGAGFTLELLKDGIYFIYDATGKALGQGQYSISSGTLTCTVGEMELVYTIVDPATLRGRAVDGSVTILARKPEEPSVGEPEGDSDVVDEDVPGDADVPDDADAPDDIIEPDSPDTEPDADAPDDSGVVEDDQDSPDTEPDIG